MMFVESLPTLSMQRIRTLYCAVLVLKNDEFVYIAHQIKMQTEVMR
nr:hypothetical protein [uncultured Undibacterium sp.]